MIGLLVADDHPIVREGLKRIVSTYDDIGVVDEAIDGDDVLSKVKNEGVDVVLLDVSMPGPGFLETLRRLRELRPGVRVLVLSVHPEDQYAVHALRAGASGYLTKDHSANELAEAIRKVHEGRRHLTESLQDRLADSLDSGGEKPLHELLSSREFQVFCMLGSGKSVTDIAEELELSPKTVSTYRARILEKTKLSGNAEVIRYAVQHGLS
ncbi:MAG: response regulator [Planctomycetota bacterium JB042]